MTETITIAQFLETEGLEDWRVLSDGHCAFYRTPSFAAAGRFVAAITGIEGLDDHSVGIDVRHDGVTVRLVTVTDEWFGTSTRDVELARAVTAVAREHALEADPSALQTLLVVPGAPAIAEVTPFWRAVLGYEPRPDSPDADLVDPHDRGPAFWFEQMDEPRADGMGAIHLAVWLPHDQAQPRLEAALAAGGRIVRDEFAPTWWTLADAAGNEVDISTALHRD